MEPQLLLGSAKMDITPPHPVPLAGFAHRAGSFESVAQPLYARIHCFGQSDREGQSTGALFVSADLIWWGTDLVLQLRPKLQERFGFETVLLHATHTHSGPQTSGSLADSLGLKDEAYLAYLEERLIEGIERALVDKEPVTVEKGGETCTIGVNRRLEAGGAIVMAPNEAGPVDPEVTVIRFRKRSGETKAVFVHYTCHPTTTDDNAVSSEFPGAALDRIEHALGGEAIGAYLQGCCGDIRPYLAEDGQFYKGHRAEVERFGWQLSDAVLRALEQPMTVLAPAALRSRSFAVELPFRDPSSRTGGALEITGVQLAEGLILLTFNAEMVADYGLFVKQASEGSILPLAYTNGMLGYVPTREMLAQGGYEAEGSVPFFRLPAPFDPSVEERIRKAVQQYMNTR
ncbi:neutral/alkaline non-lysosomal ceramidase N-terminal domain-containing protein [Paenibacillus filicis]|uniref:Neutral/alkaline non-lysosomal ceramidase N-terminal domain-containing protein n=1 Tax=Paenibacillus gyeongsangnamensis TaxID=3388067 RepID=A0ABT4Q7C9_9BACL|nr:neutral/alkaline non-lysosomal ceramidase N-terminal domain-containing protein [Paenibacillus filicis]MCZ8512728.1 neutral/alkaline non-lysosomal ceramidase N-terminal domain-containing protein [Paenibacillus filicis]